MYNKINSKGVTIVTLTIIVILIIMLSSIVVSMGNINLKESVDAKYVAELQMVQHAVLEQYVKYKTTKNENYLVGNKLNSSEVTQLENELGISLDASKDYYALNKDLLREIGIKNSAEEYVVNYEKGEVINITTKRQSNGKLLYEKSDNLP